MTNETQTGNATRQTLGKAGEAKAAAYLAQQGYRIRERNYRAVRKEIDLIAEDGQTLVFIEVKTRRTARFGMPQMAVGYRKQLRMSEAAVSYLAQHELLDRPCRFDVIAIVWRPEAVKIEHIVNAFQLAGPYHY